MQTIDKVKNHILGPLWEEAYTDEVEVRVLQVCRVRDQVWGQIGGQVQSQIEEEVNENY